MGNDKVRDKFLPYGHQWIDQSDIDAVSEALKSDYLTTGSRVIEFEKKLAEYCGAKYAVVVSSGTSALHCACYVAGITKGDEVITTPITFFATIASIIYVGGIPVLADIQPCIPNISYFEISKKITYKTKAIIPVDLGGHPVDLDVINDIAKRHKLIVIEDACHALGAEFKGKKIGSLADMTVFSFHPVKSITTSEGGAILTNNKEYYDKLCIFRSHNIIRTPNRWQYVINDAGYNYRLSDVSCALGISQLKRLDSFIDRRREIAGKYNDVFADVMEDDIIIPNEMEYVKSAYHLYIVRLLGLNRDKFIEGMAKENIGTQVHYIPAHYMPVMAKYGYKKGGFPQAESYFENAVSLPIFPAMTDKDVNDVIKAVRKVVKEIK